MDNTYFRSTEITVLNIEKYIHIFCFEKEGQFHQISAPFVLHSIIDIWLTFILTTDFWILDIGNECIFFTFNRVAYCPDLLYDRYVIHDITFYNKEQQHTTITKNALTQYYVVVHKYLLFLCISIEKLSTAPCNSFEHIKNL